MLTSGFVQDVIPFRIFRERAMAAISCDPPMFEEDELCQDFCEDALACWGSDSAAGGVGSGGAGGSAWPGGCGGRPDMAAGVPWDARSWEPRIWFLKKYWFLVGGWDDEMWRAARWWHAMRDEKISVSALTA